MGGFAGGIIAGAMGGLGGAMERQGDIAQQQQGQYNNMAGLAELNANLEVQKAGLLAKQQFALSNQQADYLQDRLNAMRAGSAASNAPQSTSSPADNSTADPSSTQAKLMPIALPSGSMASLNVGDLPTDPSGGTNQLGWATLSKRYQDQLPQNNATRAGIVSNEVAMNTDPALTPILNNEAARTGAATATPSVNYPIPSGVSGSAQHQSSPAFWVPSDETMLTARIADLRYPNTDAGKTIIAKAAPDEFGQGLIQQGKMPGTPAYIQAYHDKQLSDTSQVVRGGNTVLVGGKAVFAAADSDGNQIVYDGNGNAHIVRLAGANETAIQQAAAEKGGALMGTNSLTLAPLDARPVDANGKPIPVSINAALANGSGGSGAGLAPGIVTGKEGQQKSLTDKWTALNAANQQAQTTNSYLQNIKDLASKAATGPMSDHIDFVNGLRSLLPDSLGAEKATDAVTANDLLDKYQNQIVSRLGQGGMGTDAARSIIASAYPGAHMNLPAINEAVDNLIGANNMVKAKATLLAPHAANLDPVAYQQNELTFDKAADPRIFQYMNMTPAQKTQYVAQHPDAVKVLKEGRDALTSLGVFK